ncbi:MAG TPA: DNA polymerase Y family protein [Chryseolinea sp.]|nr:DNA polymerase Y family protein [Chryseolinea sp.]
MQGRFVSIWFHHLTTDWFSIRQPHLSQLPFVLKASSHGRMVITAANTLAEREGIGRGMVLADAKAIVPDLQVLDDIPDLPEKLLTRLALWCIRFSPFVAIDPPEGLFLDVSGCTHLWGGDLAYLADIEKKLNLRGYEVRVAIADTLGVAWGMARYGKQPLAVPPGDHFEAMLPLPPEALRLEPETVERLNKLGLRQISQFIRMPRTTLRRRFGPHCIMRMDMALGQEIEILAPVVPPEPYQDRLPCLEPIITAIGIEIALRQLLETLCIRLQQEQKGLRAAIFKCYRVDGKIESITIGTHRPSFSVAHLFKLFEIKLSTIEPALGIELFVLEAPQVEEYLPEQKKMWEAGGGLEDIQLSELVDRLTGKLGNEAIHRFIPEEHHWPERSYSPTATLHEEPTTAWPLDKPRPLHLLPKPERIEVTTPIPDYPPMLFRHKGKLHMILKADGPERIEQEWWLQQGQHRDYYRVEDEDGNRYWLFRLGHYDDKVFKWFLHGYFA